MSNQQSTAQGPGAQGPRAQGPGAQVSGFSRQLPPLTFIFTFILQGKRNAVELTLPEVHSSREALFLQSDKNISLQQASDI